MERKKIILLTTSQSAFDQRVYKIANSLQKAGGDVLWFSRKSPDFDSNSLYRQKYISCLFNKGVLFYLEYNIRIVLSLLFVRMDILTANDADTLPAAWFLSLFKKFNLYYDSHEIFSEVPELEGKKLKKKIWTFIEKLGVKQAKVCYTVNQSLANFLSKKYKRTFLIIMNVPILNNQSDPINKTDFILYQGALNKGRGLEQFIEAMPEISIPFKIAGKGNLEIDLKQKVKDLQLENKVEFLGNILPHHLQKITEQASIGLNLLEGNSLNYYYSLANKFFDYMHAGTPQICMNFPEYAAINQQLEIAVLVNDLMPQTLQVAVNKLRNNHAFYQTLHENCKVAQKQFQWKNEEQKLLKIYAL